VRVLLANKFFYPNAGAETVFFGTRDLLQGAGHEVIDFAMQSERNIESPYSRWFAPERNYDRHGSPLRQASDAAASIYSIAARRAIRGLIKSTRPEVAHLHNIYHQLSLSIVDELSAAGIPTVLTLHDYKPVCPSYVLYTEQSPCRRCVQGSIANSVVHRCVKSSLPASAIAAVEAGVARARGTYRQIDRFIAPSQFMADVMIEGGFDSGGVRVVPNFLQAAPRPPRADASPRDGFLFVGRLEEVKGVRLMLEAWRNGPPDVQLRILGTGPLQGLVEKEAAASPNISYLGFQPEARVRSELESALALLVPSLWEENCPMAILEARECNCAVIGADRGGIPELIEDGFDGLLFEAGDAGALISAVVELAANPAQATLLGTRGARSAEQLLSAGRHYESLMEVYEEAIAVNGRAGASARSPASR
jgi:glycosyltransferase involved in cell wall biosynthesis